MNSKDQSLGDIIKEVLRAYNLEDKLDETRLIQSWGKVTGTMILNHTKKLYIRNRVLFVRLDSPALRNELTYSKEKLLKLLNQEAGINVIDDIVFS